MNCSKNHPEFSITFESNEMAVRKILEQVQERLAPLDLSTDELGVLEMVLAEVLNNIVEHAYDNITGGNITLSCTPAPDGLHLQVEDTGKALPDAKLPAKKQADLEVDIADLPEGGFGWFLIRTLAKDIVYKRENSRNCLNLRLDIGLRHLGNPIPNN